VKQPTVGLMFIHMFQRSGKHVVCCHVQYPQMAW
jgi:hypothetical protein